MTEAVQTETAPTVADVQTPAALVMIPHTMTLLDLDVADMDGDIFTREAAEALLAKLVVEQKMHHIPVTYTLGGQRPAIAGRVLDMRITRKPGALTDVLEADIETFPDVDDLIRRGAQAAIAGQVKQADIEAVPNTEDRKINKFELVGIGLTMNKTPRRTRAAIRRKK